MQEFVGRRIWFDVGQSAIVKAVRENNVLPKWEGVSEEYDLTKWNDGTDVRGFDVVLEFEDGEEVSGWCADGDFLITFDRVVYGQQDSIFQSNADLPIGIYYTARQI